MFKTLLSLWVILGFCGTAMAQVRPATTYIDPQTGISLPRTLGSLTRVGKKKYDNPALGIGYRYEAAPLIKADIFIYDLGLKNLGTGVKSRQVRAHFKQVQNDIYQMEKSGRYRSVKKLAERTTTLGAPPQKIPALSAVFSYSQPKEQGAVYGGVRLSHLLLTAYKGYFLKIRFTYPENRAARGKKAWQHFLADFDKNLR